MAALEDEFVGAVEEHSVEGLRAAFDAGVNPRSLVRGKPPTVWLTEMYSRTDAFADCLRLMLDRGAILEDRLLAPVLLDDADLLAKALEADPALVNHRTTLVSAYTPLVGATLLHVAAEFGNARAARVLIDAGADVNATAATDELGLDGHTPLFHTVNSNLDHSKPVLELLLAAGARVDVQLAGINWGRGFEWETTLFDVTPISYAQFGLLPQVHRRERDIDANVRLLLEAAGRPIPPMKNVPNQYLKPRRAS